MVVGGSGADLNVTCVDMLGVSSRLLPSTGGLNPDAVILWVVELRPCTYARLEDGTS